MTGPLPSAHLDARSSYLLRGATLASPHTAWQPQRGVDIWVQDGCIQAMGDLGDAVLWRTDGTTVPKVIDARALLIVPGFVNGHTHSPEVLGRGRATHATLDEWLPQAYTGLDQLSSQRHANAIALAAQEMAASGTVAVTDHLRQRPQTARQLITAAQAWQRTGLQARIAINLRDMDIPAPVAQSAHELLDVAEQCLDTLGPTIIGLGPSAPQRCSNALLRTMAQLSEQRGTFLHTHVSETAANARECEAMYGRSPIAHLESLGYLHPRTELVHCVHVSDEDWQRMAAHQATLVHCPLANMRLGSGIAAVMRAYRAGVRVRLATDGAGSNDAQNMLEVVKAACLLSRLRPQRDEWLSPELALAMASDHQSLHIGAPAHLLAFDLNAPCFAEAQDSELLARLVLSANTPQLVWTFVSGKPIYTRPTAPLCASIFSSLPGAFAPSTTKEWP